MSIPLLELCIDRKMPDILYMYLYSAAAGPGRCLEVWPRFGDEVGHMSACDSSGAQ